MSMSLNVKAWFGIGFLAAAMGLVLFLPAGTIRWWEAWVYLGIFFGASIVITIYLMRHDPALLQRRLAAGPTAEKEPAQKIIMLIASVGFISILVVPALGYRYSWPTTPAYVVFLGDALTAVCFGITFLAYRENTFASATIGIAQDQRVISTGPYSIVRHPMYAGGLLLFTGTPLALGSYWGLVASAAVLPALIWRLLDEERQPHVGLRAHVDERAPGLRAAGIGDERGREQRHPGPRGVEVERAEVAEAQRRQVPVERALGEVGPARRVEADAGEGSVAPVALRGLEVHPVVAEPAEVEVRERLGGVARRVAAGRAQPDRRVPERQRQPEVERADAEREAAPRRVPQALEAALDRLS
jgi:protein-S-isoprenylcysteine O-methyltransferase Ste14